MKTVMKSPEELRPHPLNRELYGPPTANSAYKDIKASMARAGYDDRHPLQITEDGRILWGVTRWAVAKSLSVKEVPCLIFRPTDQRTAELEIEGEIVRGNIYRIKSQVILAREQRKLLEVESQLGRQRMGQGSDGGPSKSADRVGKIFGESGKTVQRRLKVLSAVEEAEGQGNRKKAEQLTRLLEAKHIVKALASITGRPSPAATPGHVQAPRTLHDHSTRAYSEFFEACAKARVPAEIELLAATLGRMRDDLDTARARLEPGAARRPSQA